MVVEGQGHFVLTPITAGYIACSMKGVSGFIKSEKRNKTDSNCQI